MDILEKYLNLSKESFPFNNLFSSPITNNNYVYDDITLSTNDNNSSLTFNTDVPTLTNEINSTMSPIINKKLFRPSFISLSKIIRRAFIQPFSSVKRTSLKQQRQHNNSEISNTPVLNNEKKHIRRMSSPLLNHRTNILTVIVTNFQPKRPKTCDNMIKNYIDTCMNEYQIEQNSKQLNLTTTNDKTYFNWDINLCSLQQSTINHQYHSSITPNRYKQSNSSMISNNQKFMDTSKRELPSLPINSISHINSSTKNLHKNCFINDNDDIVLMENGQFSSNINYIQQTQRKLNQPTSVRLVSSRRQRYNESKNS